LKSDPKNPEIRLRAWGMDRSLSGDIITEQNIHTLDVMSWIMNEEPVAAWGTCGHKARKDVGDCSDHFTLLFKYPKNVGITFSSRQFEGHDSPGGINNRMFGSKGVLETQYGGQVLIRGENFYKGGTTNAIYQEGAVRNIATFYQDITNGNYSNPTVEASVRSNLITILGRMAAYEKRVVTWNEMKRSREKMKPLLKGLKV
jgi:myo-inositol 2-dehydrogenase/D-chiro-inositol 1-dehydrogenase